VRGIARQKKKKGASVGEEETCVSFGRRKGEERPTWSKCRREWGFKALPRGRGNCQKKRGGKQKILQRKNGNGLLEGSDVVSIKRKKQATEKKKYAAPEKKGPMKRKGGVGLGREKRVSVNPCFPVKKGGERPPLMGKGKKGQQN